MSVPFWIVERAHEMSQRKTESASYQQRSEAGARGRNEKSLGEWPTLCIFF